LRNPIEASHAATGDRRRLSSMALSHCEEVDDDDGSLWAWGGGKLGGTSLREVAGYL
jgi:hypothetical protein